MYENPLVMERFDDRDRYLDLSRNGTVLNWTPRDMRKGLPSVAFDSFN